MLPNPSMSFSPFAILTAEEMNELVENIESIADGTGIGDGAVTPVKRSGGYYVGMISTAILGTTGNKSITGVGFRPKMVRFYLDAGASSGSISGTNGSMTTSSQFLYTFGTNGTATNRYTSASYCAGWITGTTTTTTPTLLASYVSMDADGFTINVTVASNVFGLFYEAYA